MMMEEGSEEVEIEEEMEDLMDIVDKEKVKDIVDKVKKWVKESRTNNGAAVFKRHGVEKKLITVNDYLNFKNK